MKTRSKYLASAVLALATAGFGAGAIAQTASPAQPQAESAAPAAGYETQKEMLRPADGALAALMDVHAARVALGSDDTETATTKVAAALTAFEQSETDWKALAVTDDQSNAQDSYVPFDVAMSLAEDFVPDDAGGKALAKADSQIQSGDHDGALETLRVARVDVSVSAAMLPMQATSDALVTAQQALTDGDKDAAVQALLGIEKSVVVRGYALDGIPRQQPT